MLRNASRRSCHNIGRLFPPGRWAHFNANAILVTAGAISPVRHGSTGGGLSPSRKTVGTPVLAAYTVVDEEKSIRIVLRLDGSQFRIVLTPICVLPGVIEVVALRNIGARVRNDLA